MNAGDTLGPYRILDKLGEGGMGEVYRATDTTLRRDVAVKVLPGAFASDPERLARFEREAQLLAALNHPHIAAIYGVAQEGAVRALVLELVEGPTLADRIAAGALPLDEALPIARQIAEALEAAHEQGIIHRDLKPANIKQRPDGTVKVLDFGLAKVLDQAPGLRPQAAGEATQSPTLTSPLMTQRGVILGTAAYMSPEQARGREADRRSDIWAFGCVLFEMLTGARAFPGDEITDTLAAIVRAEPDWTALPAETPAAIRRLLRRCLEKTAKERLPHVGAARLDIVEAIAHPDDDRVPATPVPMTGARSSARLAWSVAALALASTAGLGVAWMKSTAEAPATAGPAYRVAIPLPAGAATPSHLALSPDGSRLAYVAPAEGGRTMIWLRPLDGGQAQPLAGTDGATAPFWSPDSSTIAFLANGKLRKMPAAGGTITPLADADYAVPGAWSRDGIIVFSPHSASPLFRVPATGGTATPATRFKADSANLMHVFPAFLDDGRHFLFVEQSPNGSRRSIQLASLDEPVSTLLLGSDAADSGAVVSQAHLVYTRGRTLVAQRFDGGSLSVVGDPMVLAENVEPMNALMSGGARFAVSRTGALIYLTNEDGLRQLSWLDRLGQRVGLLGEPGEYGDGNVSPDGRSLAISGRGGGLWLLDVARGLRTRLAEDMSNTWPVWSPDGSRLVFASRRQGQLDLFEKAVGAPVGSETVLLADSADKFPSDWSPDGRFVIYYARTGQTSYDLWLLPMTGDRKPRPFQSTPFSENYARFSPDGRWVAYQSDESGRYEIMVAPFPGPGAAERVSPSGGNHPRWRADGRELFYRSPNNKMVAVEVSSAGGRLSVGQARELFDMGSARRFGMDWSVTADGQRFLVNLPADQNAAPSLSLLVNWPALIGR